MTALRSSLTTLPSELTLPLGIDRGPWKIALIESILPTRPIKWAVDPYIGLMVLNTCHTVHSNISSPNYVVIVGFFLRQHEVIHRLWQKNSRSTCFAFNKKPWPFNDFQLQSSSGRKRCSGVFSLSASWHVILLISIICVGLILFFISRLPYRVWHWCVALSSHRLAHINEILSFWVHFCASYSEAIKLNATRAAGISANLVIKHDVTKVLTKNLSFCLLRWHMRIVCSGTGVYSLRRGEGVGV